MSLDRRATVPRGGGSSPGAVGAPGGRVGDRPQRPARGDGSRGWRSP